MSNKYQSQKFLDWAKENQWFPYGPKAAHNPLYKGNDTGEWTHQGKRTDILAPDRLSTPALYELFEKHKSDERKKRVSEKKKKK